MGAYIRFARMEADIIVSFFLVFRVRSDFYSFQILRLWAELSYCQRRWIRSSIYLLEARKSEKVCVRTGIWWRIKRRAPPTPRMCYEYIPTPCHLESRSSGIATAAVPQADKRFLLLRWWKKQRLYIKAAPADIHSAAWPLRKRRPEE